MSKIQWIYCYFTESTSIYFRKAHGRAIPVATVQDKSEASRLTINAIAQKDGVESCYYMHTYIFNDVIIIRHC